MEALERRSPDVPLQAMDGTFEREGDAVVFTPRFLFAEGVRYALLVDGEPIASIVRPKGLGLAFTTVTRIAPTSTIVPVNLLRLYIHFSAPMSEGQAADAVSVCCAGTGEPLQDVLLDMTHELWDPARTRLTVLLDPARIKRGLVPNMEAGYPLIQGRPIVVFVDASFSDANGRPLPQTFSRRYDVGPHISERVDLARWRMSRPANGSRDPLDIVFDRPLDRPLLARCLSVQNGRGEAIEGRIHVSEGERWWTFVPVEPWSRGAGYTLAIDTRLEDVAGNSVVRVFDRDLTRREDDPAGEHRLESLKVDLR